MELFKIALKGLCTLLLSIGSQDALKAAEPAHILYLVHTNKLDKALEHYQDYVEKFGRHDTEFLQQLGLSVLELGAKSNDPETLLMTIFGAGIAMNEKTMYILQRCLGLHHPQLQLIALNFLARFHDDEADRWLLSALKSNSLLVRLEAAHLISLNKHPKASYLVESLMEKVDAALVPLFPQLFAAIGNADSEKVLRKLLAHSSEEVRIEAIRSCAKMGRDDFLPRIISLCKQPSHAQQEACAHALGIFKNESALDHLNNFAKSSSLTIRLTALQALHRLGITHAQAEIKSLAAEGDLFAITVLSEIPGNQNLLYELAQNKNFHVSVNAVLGLLKQGDPRCKQFLSSILLRDSRDLAFVKAVSRGRALSCWKSMPSARQNYEDFSLDLEISQQFREAILEEAVNLPEDTFYEIITPIFDKQQNDLVPTAVSLLEQLHTEKAIQFLKRYQQHAGAPLIRNYCCLALYRLQEEGPYAETLRQWILKQSDAQLIQLRPSIPWEMDSSEINYHITPHETSRLLVETFETFAERQDNAGINALLHAVRNGNNSNKYALAGLLMRASL